MIDLSIDLESSILPTTCPTTEDEKPTATSKIVIKIPQKKVIVVREKPPIIEKLEKLEEEKEQKNDLDLNL